LKLCRCRLSETGWTTLPSASPLLCDSERQLSALTCVSVARQSPSTVITACLVDSDPVVSRATTKSMMCSVVRSSRQAHWRHVNHMNCALAGVNDRMDDTVSLVTWPLPSMGCDLPRHVRSVARSGQQYTCWFSGSNRRSDEIAEVGYADITTGVDFISVAIETSGTWASRPFISSCKSAADWQL